MRETFIAEKKQKVALIDGQLLLAPKSKPKKPENPAKSPFVLESTARE